MAIASQLAAKPALATEGARVGAEFRLGACTAAWRGRRFSGRLLAGVILLALMSCGLVIPALGTTGTARAINGGIDAAIVAWAVLLITLPPRSWIDRLFLCQAGIALLDARQPEPMVLRWAHLDSVSITTGVGYEGVYVSGCVLRDKAGNALTVSQHLKAIAEVAAEAERVLAPRLLPALITRFDSGQPVVVGRLTAHRHGLRWGAVPGVAQSPAEWGASWSEVRAVHFDLQGQRAGISIGWDARRHQGIVTDDEPNSFLIRYLIAHAAATAGITVTGHGAHWDGESGWDPEATLAAVTLPAPAKSRRPARKRHPVRTALIAALLTGILAGWALTFDHGGVILQPGNSNSDNSDTIVSSPRASAHGH